MNEVRVHVDIDGRPVLAGTAFFTTRRSNVTTTVVYDVAYLADRSGYDLEPALPRQAGQQYVDGLPGSFADCSPDRWGRNLLDKRRRAEQRHASQRLPAATETDYLLGVSDITRQGNLRFRDGDGPFLGPHEDVPRLVSLPQLLASADRVGSDADLDDFSAVKALLDAGSGSLGGARPKASVRGDDGTLMIAKFPHAADEWDVMAWEKTMLDLAQAAGLRVPCNRLTTVGSRSVLLVSRFDREVGGVRLGYISAMTLVGARDGDDRDYVDIIDALSESGAMVNEDLKELFARVVFSVAVHNTDDHLRNHGFLRRRGGWALSPLFDVNPNPDLRARRMTGILGAVDSHEEVAALCDLAQACRLSPAESADVVRKVVQAVRTWRRAAAVNGIAPGEVRRFAEAIDARVAELEATA
ncbi:MAG TPA: type II toxin-antitoxin system HipA family toxin [Ornithinibacter sp.]|nr:type II toxin-antitoxin system HipA family toxin [Dermatophilaceae bacterium]HRA25645.1 type II toxin-antitoxin system HipA family toxin [Ornithinibacter sp.]